MKNTFFSLLLWIVSFLLVLAPQTSEGNVLRLFNHGDKMPEFSLPLLGASGHVEYAPAIGRPAVLFFFSVDPDFRKKRSLALLSELDDLAAKYKNKADIIGIYSEEKKADVVLDYMADRGLKINVCDDSQRLVYNRYGVFMMPLVVFVDAAGKLHEVVPYTYNVRELVEGNLKLMLGEWTVEQFQESMQPKETEIKSEEEKEYIRRINYGKVMITRKMYSQAVREFSTAVKLMPKMADGYVALGFAQLNLKQFGSAEQIFRDALKIEADSDEAIAGLGLALYGKGEVEKALPELENALIVPEPKLEVIVALAEIYEQKGNIDKAMRLNKLAVSKLMFMYEKRWQ